MMKSNYRKKFALLSLAVAFFLGCAISGCNKEEVYTTANYQHDSTYRATLEAIQKDQLSLGKRRADIERQRRELISAAGGEERAKALPQWAKLDAAAKACDQEFDELRKKATATVRERMNRALEAEKKISK